MLWGIPDPDLSLFVGLNAKARRVAGLISSLYNLIISGRVKLLAVEIVVSCTLDNGYIGCEVKMTVEKFLETLKLVQSTDSKLQLQKYLETVSNTLVNLTNSPAEPSYQSTLATALADLKRAAAAIPGKLSVAELKAIASIQGAEYFDPQNRGGSCRKCL